MDELEIRILNILINEKFLSVIRQMMYIFIFLERFLYMCSIKVQMHQLFTLN